MSWSGNASVHIKRDRMEMLDKRTQSTVLPSVEEIFANADDLEETFALDIMDKIYFSINIFESNVSSPRLKIFKITTRRNF